MDDDELRRGGDLAGLQQTAESVHRIVPSCEGANSPGGYQIVAQCVQIIGVDQVLQSERRQPPRP